MLFSPFGSFDTITYPPTFRFYTLPVDIGTLECNTRVAKVIMEDLIDLGTRKYSNLCDSFPYHVIVQQSVEKVDV